MSQKQELDRIVFFSDAVFAIAITLLALNIKLPNQIIDPTSKTLFHVLLRLLPDYQSYIISFTVIGIYWIGHHHYFRHIVRYDYTLISLNIAFLACIAFLPFPTTVLEDYNGLRMAVIFYAASMALTGFLKSLWWWYASHRHRLIYRQLRPQHICSFLVPPLVFSSSIAIAYFNPTLAEFSWGFIILLLIGLKRFTRN